MIFANPSPDKELWGPFLEKAWAKVSGNYEVTESGWTAEAMRFLTNAPSTDYDTTLYDVAGLIALVQPADKAGFIMTASTATSTAGDTAVNAVGLAMNHAYTLIGLTTVVNKTTNAPIYLFKMRNPWGVDGDYKGIWSDNPKYSNLTLEYAT